MDTQQRLLIDMVRGHLRAEAIPIPEDVDWEDFVRLACGHGLSAMAYGALPLDEVPNTVPAALEADYRRALFRDAQRDYIRSEITRLLTQAAVEHVFLRGICLKWDYPAPALRTMSDIDVLIHGTDFGAVDQAMTALGGQRLEGDGNHRTYYVEAGGVTVEFHPNLIHCASPVGTGINPGWQYVATGAEGGERFLTEEGFYLNVLCHLANHFAAGGVGVRFVLDVWVCRHLRKAAVDRVYVERELTEMDLLDFARNIEALGDYWFSDGVAEAVPAGLEEYIFTSGAHGNQRRAMLNAVCLSPGRSRASAFMKKVFYPAAELEDRFPWCRGKPWLLPAAWCTRAWRVVTRRGALVSDWTKGMGEFSRQEIREHGAMLARFGIRGPEI